MSDEAPAPEPAPAPRKEIRPLKKSGTIRLDPDAPRPGAGTPVPDARAAEVGGSAEPAPGQGPEREIKALAATTSRLAPSPPADSRPMVLDREGARLGERRPERPAAAHDAADGAGPPEPGEGGEPPAAEGDEAPTLSELLGEVASLRSRNQILRTERTSIAGRKYALEVVLETIKGKLEELARACDALDAPGELGERLAQLRELIGSARRVVLGREVLEDELEAERKSHLEEVRRLELLVSEQGEDLAGARAERDRLRARVGQLERDRGEAAERALDLEEQLERQGHALGQLKSGADELEALRGEYQALREQLAAREQERAELMDRAAELEAGRAVADAAAAELAALRLTLGAVEADRDAARAEAERAVAALDEAVAAGEQVMSRAEAGERTAAAAEARAAAAEDRLRELEGALAQAVTAAADADARRGEAEARAQDAAGQVDLWRQRAEAAREALGKQRGELEAVTGRVSKGEAERLRLEARVGELEEQAEKAGRRLEEQRAVIVEVRPMLERLDADNQRLTRLLGEARARGRVDVQELLKRAELLRRLERLAAATAAD